MWTQFWETTSLQLWSGIITPSLICWLKFWAWLVLDSYRSAGQDVKLAIKKIVSFGVKSIHLIKDKRSKMLLLTSGHGFPPGTRICRITYKSEVKSYFPGINKTTLSCDSREDITDVIKGITAAANRLTVGCSSDHYWLINAQLSFTGND